MNPTFSEKGTNVKGYFNANRWPVNLSVSSVGLVFQLAPNQFILDQQGNKVNDPALEVCVGPMKLSREMSNDLLPINRLAQPRANPVTSTVSGSPAKIVVPQSIKAKAPAPAMAATSPATVTPNASVRAMTMEEARRIGAVKPTTIPNEDAPDDNAGAPPTGAPVISYARDVVVGRNTRQNAAVQPTRPAAPQPPQAQSQPEVESQPQAESLTDSEVVDQVPGLPEPDLGDEPSAGDEPVEQNPPGVPPSQDDLKFVCKADDKKFRFRSQLEKHVRRKYNDRFEELMADYPKRGS